MNIRLLEVVQPFYLIVDLRTQRKMELLMNGKRNSLMIYIRTRNIRVCISLRVTSCT